MIWESRDPGWVLTGSLSLFGLPYTNLKKTKTKMEYSEWSLWSVQVLLFMNVWTFSKHLKYRLLFRGELLIPLDTSRKGKKKGQMRWDWQGCVVGGSQGRKQGEPTPSHEDFCSHSCFQCPPPGFGWEARAGAGLQPQECLHPLFSYQQTILQTVGSYKGKSPPGPA